MTHIKYLLNCKKFISLMILFSFFDNFGMDASSIELNDVNKNLFSSDKEWNAKSLHFNVGFVGASGVGKTHIISRFVGMPFSKALLPTFGVDYFEKEVKVNGQDISLFFWDISGQNLSFNLVCSFFESFELIIFVYAVDDNASFEKVKAFFNTYQEKNLKIGTLLVGNKIDLVDARTVSRKTGENYAKENGMLYFEISAETETCFSEVFFEPFISKFLAEKNLNEISRGLDNDNNSIGLNSSFSDECCSCCPCLKKSEESD